MYDFGMTANKVRRYEESISEFIADSLGVKMGKHNLLTRLKIKYWRVTVERCKSEDLKQETVRVFKRGKLVGEKCFQHHYYL